MSKRFGFTLAEVLITLGIIGVIAGITIPVLMNNIQDQQFKVAYNKAYSAASQAWMNANTNGTIVPCSQWQDSGGITCNYDNFIALKNEMKITKDCGNVTSGCWNMSGEKAWQGGGDYPKTNAPSFIDASGTAWSKLLNSANAGEVLVDVNGNRAPNQYGRDRAVFVLYYYTFDNTNQRGKANIPSISFFPDFPSATWSSNAEQLNRCPSMNTHPCYYTSWITGEH